MARYDIFTKGKIRGRFDLVVAAHLGSPVLADADLIVTVIEPANGALVVAAQPDVPRNLTLTTVDANASISAGTVTVVGKDAQGRTVKEVFNIKTAGTKVGTKIFASVTSATVAGVAGVGAGVDTITVGVGNIIGLPSDIVAESAVKTVLTATAIITPDAVKTGKYTSGVDCNSITYDGAKTITVFYNVGE